MGNVNFEIGATTVLGPLLAAFGLLLALRARRGRAGWTGRHAVTRLLAAAYAAGVLSLTIFPIVVTYGEFANQMPWTNQINWIPMPSPDPSIVANVILTVPLGMLLPLMSARVGSKGRATAVTAAVSLSIELTQLLMYVVCNNARLTDTTDLLVNTLGGFLGFVVLHRAARIPALARLLHTFALPGSAFASNVQTFARPTLRPAEEATATRA
ncbi:VanZ family protein [Streptomyces sp. NPDC096132]|uniref:VanZ family protein n=1 Tax=Streptomyces sp. NPDC096132 TaxID=3366075 RepID=UPI0037F5189B